MCDQWIHTSAFEVQHSLRGPVSPLERALFVRDKDNLLFTLFFHKTRVSLFVLFCFCFFLALLLKLLSVNITVSSFITRQKPALPSVRSTIVWQTLPVVKEWVHKLMWWSSNPVGVKIRYEDHHFNSQSAAQQHHSQRKTESDTWCVNNALRTGYAPREISLNKN